MRGLPEGVLEDGGSRKSLVGSQNTVSELAPEQERGVLERGTAKLYLLELDRTVILSNKHGLEGKHLRSQDSIEQMP